MNKKAGFELSVNFLVILIICLVIFGSSIYLVRKFFTHAETIKMTYDERTEKEIERLLEDGDRVAIPFDKKTIHNGESKTFGIGILNMLDVAISNTFETTIKFNKAFDKQNNQICSETAADTTNCGNPELWIQTTEMVGTGLTGVTSTKSVKNNEQVRFLLGVGPKGATPGTYIYDVIVCYDDQDAGTSDIHCTGTYLDQYDTLRKIYVDVP